MDGSLQMKVPGGREQKKPGQDLQYRQGQRVEIPVGLRKATATVISTTKAGDEVVVRLRQQHNRQLNREESQELSRLLAELKRYEHAWRNGGVPSALERAEGERVRGRINQLTDLKPVKITRTFAIEPEQIKVRQISEPKRQRVSDTEKRKLQKQQLLKKVQSALMDGVSPKRLKRMLKRTQFDNIKVGKGKREYARWE